MQCPNQTKSYWISHEWRVEGTWHSALAFRVTTYSPQRTTLHCVGKSTTVDKIRPARRYIVITVYLSPKTFWLMGFKFFTAYLLIQKSWILIHFYRNLMEARTFITFLLSLLGKSEWNFWNLKVQNCNLQSTRKINKQLFWSERVQQIWAKNLLLLLTKIVVANEWVSDVASASYFLKSTSSKINIDIKNFSSFLLEWDGFTSLHNFTIPLFSKTLLWWCTILLSPKNYRGLYFTQIKTR